VRYEEAPFVKPLVGASSPLKLKSGAEQFGRVVSGLREEWEGLREPKHIHHWVTLLHSLALRATTPWCSGPRIAEVWELVSRELASDWKLTTLATRCSLSPEHLRRLCLRELGRTPMEHLTYMRIQRAQELLENTDEKLESIAPQVGYRSAQVFSRAFTRCVGMTPSEYRSQR
jgi:AraC-like DNA-binding protein